jgi:hypothetical protein
MNMNPNDPLVTLPEAATRMGVKVRRARSILIQNQIQTVRTQYGICYRLDDIEAVRSRGR